MITASILFKDEFLHLQHCIESLAYQKAITHIQIITTSAIDIYYDFAIRLINGISKTNIFKDKIFSIIPMKFQDDFSYLRNYANTICKTKYILHIDCDERLVAPNDYQFFDLLDTYDKDLFIGSVFGWHTYIRQNSKYYKYDCARLMNKNVKWINEVHEVPDLANNKVSSLRSYKIAHLGYDISKSDMMEKIQRNIQLLNNAKSMKPKTKEMYLNLTANILNA